jgi:hypothetical protein
MKHTEAYKAALAFIDERARLVAELTTGGDAALTALVIVLISAGYNFDQMHQVVRDLMGPQWLVPLQDVLDRGIEGPDPIWTRHNDTFSPMHTQLPR